MIKKQLIAIVIAMLGLTALSVTTRADGLISELKIGGLYHDPGDLWSGFRREPKSLDVNIEALFGPHIDFLWGTLRPAMGATINTHGATSKAYMDARWEIEAPSGIFFTLGLGGAIHDGDLSPIDPTRKALGTRLLFHIPAELGWRWDGHNSISLYFEHMSNAYTQDYNEGLDCFGIRYGYRF
jgi:lipid A 3-O-deacylase